MRVVVLVAVGRTSVLLMLLVPVTAMVLVVLIVVERLPEIHLHIAPVASPAIHHDIMPLVPMSLVKHAVLMGRLWARRSGRRGSVRCSERYARVRGGGCADAGREVAVNVLRVLWVEWLGDTSLVSRSIGHQRLAPRRLCGWIFGTEGES